MWSQLTGRMANQHYVERALGLSGITFASAVLLLTIAAFVPMVLASQGLTSRCAA